MLKRHKLNNRRGQIFTISVIIAVTGALISSFFLLKFMYEPKNDKEFLGSYQSAIIDALADGDKTLLYVDQAAKMAVNSALDEYINVNSPKPGAITGATNEAVGEGEINDKKNCGNYVYRLWNTETIDCFPEDYNSKNFELSSLINEHLMTFNYMKTNTKEPLYVDKILKQSITYNYKYYTSVDSTKIYGLTNDKYIIGAFRDEETKKNSDIQQYLDSKNSYSGNLIWPLKQTPHVGSCFGFRGVVDPGNDQLASVNHAGIDIGATFDTPVYASAAGTVLNPIEYPQWGKVTIDHGNGLKTVYMHMNKIIVEVNQHVAQGDQIGTVGGRGFYPTLHKDHPEWGPYNNYGPHLHFSVISDTVDPNTNYDGIKAVVIGDDGKRYVNPLCFIDQEAIKNLDINRYGLACNSICYQQGSVACQQKGTPINYCQDMSTVKCVCSGDNAYSKTTCSKDGSDSYSDPPYKFCDVYKGVIAKEVPCAKSSNADWEITSVKLSKTNLKSDETLKISMTMKNKGTVCVNVKQKIEFTTLKDSSEITFTEEGGSTNVYKPTDTIPYYTSELSCTFTSDMKLREEGEKAGKCVLWVPDNNKPATYTLSTIKGVDYSDIAKEYTADTHLTFSVSKASLNSGNANNDFVPSTVQLTPEDQATIDKTRANLEKLGVMDEITKQTISYVVPEEIILATITLESANGNSGTAPLANDAKGVVEQTKIKVESLRKYFDMYYTKDAAYISAVNSKNTDGTPICYNDEFRNKYLTYTGWERALRAYYGFGCKDVVEASYVENVMKYTAGWKYRSEYVSASKDEANKGILATYKIIPTFNVKVDFDISLFNKLRDFANKTVLECGREDQDKKVCVQEHVSEFNKVLFSEYGTRGKEVALSTYTCDDTPKIAAINKFVEELNNCAASSDTNCQCAISSSEEQLKVAESIGDYTRFRYNSEKGEKEIYLDYNITKDNVPLSEKGKILNNLYIKELSTYKNSSGNLTIGIKPSLPTCTPAQNRFRFCLKTNYKYTTYNSIDEKTETKQIIIPFALLIRNQIAPAAVNGTSASNLEHANNTIILKWDNNTEADVVKYNIYFADDQTEFQRPTSALRSINKFVSVSNDPKNYAEYKDIKTDTPTCKLQSTFDSDYCIFEYSAIDKDGKSVSITLQPGSMYYLSDSKKIMYILSSKDTGITLTSGQEKFIAITAVDVDDNEISNADGSSFVLGENLVSITPEDKLEVGLTRITSYNFDDTTNTLQLLWNEVNVYIDGSPLSESSNYDIYLQTESCTVDQLNEVSTSATPQTITKDSSIEIQIAKPPAGTQVSYCIYVIPELTNNGYMKGFAKTINVGDGVGSQSGTTTPTPQQSGIPMAPIPIYYMPLFG